MDPLMKITPYLTREEHEVSSKNDEKNSAEVRPVTIPDEVEEAAAKAMFAEEQCDRRQREDVEGNWHTRLSDDDQAEYALLARAALVAVLPTLRRQIAEEIAVAIEAEALSDYDAADALRWAAVEAREIGAGTASARTGTPATTDLPPAPQALSKRLPGAKT